MGQRAIAFVDCNSLCLLFVTATDPPSYLGAATLAVLPNGVEVTQKEWEGALEENHQPLEAAATIVSKHGGSVGYVAMDMDPGLAIQLIAQTRPRSLGAG